MYSIPFLYVVDFFGSFFLKIQFRKRIGGKKFSWFRALHIFYTLLCCNLVEDISHTSWLLWWFEVLSLLTLLVVFRRVLDTLRQHFLTMTIQATSRSSQHVSKLAPINRLNVPPTSHSKSMVPYPTSSLMYSNSRFWKNTTETFSDSTPDLFSDTKHSVCKYIIGKMRKKVS